MTTPVTDLRAHLNAKRQREAAALRKRMRELDTEMILLRTPTKIPRDCGRCGELCLVQDSLPQHTARCLECISPPRFVRQKARSLTEEEEVLKAIEEMYLETDCWFHEDVYTEEEVDAEIEKM